MEEKFMKKKKKILSLTKKDFDWTYFRGTGKGGQKRNKTSNACRCIHQPSKAMGVAQDTRSQIQNKRLAFQRCITTKQFKQWSRIQCAKNIISFKEIEKAIERELNNPRITRIEVKDKNNKWGVETC